jgi:hypothetical protein
VPQAREQFAEYQRLRGLTQEVVTVSERICDARILNERTEEGSKRNVAEIDSLPGRGSSDGIDLKAPETAARRQALSLSSRAIQQKINADSADYAGAHLSCKCGEPARYAGRRVKSFQSVLGELRRERAYDHCQACSRGFRLRDRVGD